MLSCGWTCGHYFRRSLIGSVLAYKNEKLRSGIKTKYEKQNISEAISGKNFESK